MTDTARSRGASPGTAPAPPAPTGWVGMIAFAAAMMIMIGTFHAISGLVAIFDDGYYLVASDGLLIPFDYTAWGWVHLLLGALLVAGGAALLSGRRWARVLAVVLAVISAFANFAFISSYPVWSSIMLAVDVLVIWAVTVHGDEMRSRR
jgi:hypothetical protein